MNETTNSLIIDPMLIAFGTMAWIENDVMSSVIQTSFITSNFTDFTVEPILIDFKPNKAIMMMREGF